MTPSVAVEDVKKTQRRRRRSKANAAQVYRLLADASDVSLKQAQELLDVIRQITIQQLRERGSLTLPNLVHLKALKKDATPARTKKVLGREIHIKAKPMRTVLKPTILQQLHDGISTE